MSKNISISDDVYERLRKEKGDRSFSEVIADTLDSEAKIADVTGQQLLDPDTYEEVIEEIERLSEGTIDRLDNETA